HPELIICELTDENGNNVPQGEAGELTITTLGVEGMPLLRFRTGDLVRFHSQPCQCGRTSLRISPIIGRLNQMIKYKGTTLYPPAIFDVLDNVFYLENYLIEVVDNACGNDDVLVKVGLREQPDFDVIKDLKDRFRARIRVAPEVEICSADRLRTIIMPDSSRKPIKMIDKRRKNRI
ncbi:MAG: phenylacetate--CoA ligase family protein, partial [Lentimicrobiaceae bacterium]|nr:phenylacetate--CoA ligase family protein [Lentimicrobiaceae bacterium]